MSLYAFVAMILALVGGGGWLYRKGSQNARAQADKANLERRLKAIQKREQDEHEAHQMDDASLADRLTERD